jgi:hypothetical protein
VSEESVQQDPSITSGQTTNPPTAASGQAEDFEQMFDREGCPGEVTPELATEITMVLDPVNKRLEALAGGIATIMEKLSELCDQSRRLADQDGLLAEMHKQCRAAGERVFEREVLDPVAMTLISIAGRCRQQVAKMQSLLETHARSSNKAALLAIRRILEARTADRIEVEAVLANYGIEPYEGPDNDFDPSTQKCISRQEREDASLHGRVAQRLLPGYRRNGRILRPEYVSVYVGPGVRAKGE